MTNQRSDRFDLVVIGAGAAGLSVASGGAQLGLKVALIEHNDMGGDCLNAGCVPSKALLAVAKAKHQVDEHAGHLGIKVRGEITVDYGDAMVHVRRSIDAIAPHDSQERFEGLGVEVIRTRARLLGPNAVQAGDRRLMGTLIVIATGARASLPPIPGLDAIPYDTNETLFQRSVKPEKLVVVGGGPIGCEMAQAHARLGSDVVLIEQDKLLPKDDEEAVQCVRDSLSADGVEVREGYCLEKLVKTTQGFEAHCREMSNNSAVVLAGSDLLIAAGRQPNVEGLGLEAVGVAHTSRGIEVNQRLQTSVKSIYAIGDVTGGHQFTHMAGSDASAFVRGALFRMPIKARKAKVPWVTFCDPELAQYGMTEARARASGDLFAVHRVDLKDLDRSVTDADTGGFAKIMLDRRHRLLGVTIVGGGAGDLLTPWLAIDAGQVKLQSVAGMIVPYPTRGEVTKRLAGLAFVDRLFSASTQSLIRLLFRLPRF